MTSNTVRLIPVPAEKKHILENLLNLYLHELSQFVDDLHINADGRFEYEGMELYFQREELKPFFVYSAERVTGFILLNTGRFAPQGIDYVIHEFFILKGYRGKGVARSAISKLLSQNSGRYRIDQLTSNIPAIRFWKNFYAHQGIEYSETIQIVDGLECSSQVFPVKYCARRIGMYKIFSRKKPEKLTIQQQLDAEFTDFWKKAAVPGLAAVMFTKNAMLYKTELGFCDVEKKVPFTIDTVINTASVSKLFIAAALVKAAAEGVVDLDEDINSYLPYPIKNPHLPNEKITLRHLATHTSGIRDDEETYRVNSFYHSPEPPSSLGDFLFDYLHPLGKLYKKENFLASKPGQRYEYSNIGSSLAAFCIEESCGIPYSQYVQQRVFQPLGMNSSGWDVKDFPGNAAVNYSRVRVDIENNRYRLGLAKIPLPRYKLVTYPDGGVVSSVADLRKFLAAVMAKDRPEFLDSETIDLMLRKQFVDKDIPDQLRQRKQNTGLFWSYNGIDSFGHSGDDPGVNAVVYIRQNGVAVIFLMNTDVISLGKARVARLYNVLSEYSEKLV